MEKLIFLLTWLLLSNLTSAQVYPRLQSILVLTKISFEKADSVFFFNYTLTNPANSKGSIIRYEIDISVPPNSVRMDTIGLRFENDGFSERHFRRRFPTLKDKIVPLSFLSSPGRWGGLFSNNLTAVWDGYPLINPGETLNGFTLMSKGIPGIRRCIVSPRFDVDTIFPDIEDTTRILTIIQMDSIREALNFRGWVIGPTVPPLNFIATVWCDTLLSYTHQSVQLGWLLSKRDYDCDEDEQPNDGVSKNIEKRIERARKELVQGDSAKARKELEKFVKKVDKIYKKSEEFEKNKPESEFVITSEAYALLKYNAKYLIDRLPYKKDEKNDDKGED